MNNRKQLVLRVAVIVILSISLINCNGTGKKEQLQQVVAAEIDAPENIITLEQADDIYSNYSKHRVSAIESYETKERAPSEKFEAARFVDFDYETIKNYIAYIDQEAAKAGVKKVTKLRMYFANYPNKERFSDNKKVVHPRQNSIFMTPTLAKDGGNYSFYIGDDGKAKLIIDWKAEIQKGMGAVLGKQKVSEASLIPSFSLNSNLYAGTSLIFNRGGNGPPPPSEFQ